MPYRQRDAWHRQTREFLRDRGPTVSRLTMQKYRLILETCGSALGHPAPAGVCLREMRELEASLDMEPASKAVYCSVARAFLRWTGNRDAQRWRVLSHQRPKVDGVFLSEQTVQYVRQVASQLGTEHELVFSLCVDNGCRLVDLDRMTMANARELMSQGVSMILSKGRGGGKPRPLVLSQATLRPLARYLQARGTSSPRLFPFGRGAMRRRMIELSDKSSVPFRPHDLRRTFGHRHWLAGTPIETIARLMGHESVDQTFRCYIGVQMDDMLQAQRRLCPEPTGQLLRVS